MFLISFCVYILSVHFNNLMFFVIVINFTFKYFYLALSLSNFVM